MKRRITRHVMRKSAGMALLILLALPLSTFAAEEKGHDAMNDILQSSSLSKTEQADIHERAAVAINSGIPADDVEIIVSRAVKRGADAGTINGFIDTVLSAKKAGLPTGPVLDRIEQGLSKGVPPGRIDAASRQLAEKLAVAQPLVDELIRNGVKPRGKAERVDAIEATARALEKSLSVDDLKSMGASVQSRKGSMPLFTSAVNTSAYFAGSGMSAKTATRIVRDAVGSGYSERDLDGMVRRTAEEMRRGTSAEDAGLGMERGNMDGGRGMEQQDMGGGRGMGSGSGSGTGSMGGHRK